MIERQRVKHFIVFCFFCALFIDASFFWRTAALWLSRMSHSIEGIALSGSFLAANQGHLARCVDAAPWAKAPGGAWILHRCLARLGLALTPGGGWHHMDEKVGGWIRARASKSCASQPAVFVPCLLTVRPDNGQDPVFLRHILEDHPVAPFLSLKWRPWVFTPSSRLGAAGFFEAMSRDPVAFLAPATCEVQHGRGSGSGLDLGADTGSSSSSMSISYTAAVAVGLSVRLWPEKRGSMIWDRTRAEAVSPPPHVNRRRSVRDDGGNNADNPFTPQSVIRYEYARGAGSVTTTGESLTLYLPDRRVVAKQQEPMHDAQISRGGVRGSEGSDDLLAEEGMQGSSTAYDMHGIIPEGVRRLNAHRHRNEDAGKDGSTGAAKQESSLSPRVNRSDEVWIDEWVEEWNVVGGAPRGLQGNKVIRRSHRRILQETFFDRSIARGDQSPSSGNGNSREGHSEVNHFPWAAVVVVVERRGVRIKSRNPKLRRTEEDGDALRIGSPRPLCHVATHELVRCHDACKY